MHSYFPWSLLVLTLMTLINVGPVAYAAPSSVTDVAIRGLDNRDDLSDPNSAMFEYTSCVEMQSSKVQVLVGHVVYSLVWSAEGSRTDGRGRESCRASATYLRLQGVQGDKIYDTLIQDPWSQTNTSMTPQAETNANVYSTVELRPTLWYWFNIIVV